MKKKIFISLVAIILLAVGAVWLSLESIVKTVVNKYGSEITGTEVKLGGFQFSPLNGTASVSRLTVANPKNYKSPYLFDLGSINVKVDVKSLTTDTIVIEEINIQKPVITYEMRSLTQNNIKQIQENISKNTASAVKEEQKTAAEPKKSAEQKAASKKVIIKKVIVAGGEIKAETPLEGKAAALDVKLPEITLKDIGQDKKGESIAASISKIFAKILNTASQTVVKSGLNDVKNIAKENLDNVVGGVKDKVKSIGIFGK